MSLYSNDLRDPMSRPNPLVATLRALISFTGLLILACLFGWVILLGVISISQTGELKELKDMAPNLLRNIGIAAALMAAVSIYYLAKNSMPPRRSWWKMVLGIQAFILFAFIALLHLSE